MLMPSIPAASQMLSGKWSTRFLPVALFLLIAISSWNESLAQTVQVDATPSHVVNKFSPLYALGTTVDRVPSNATSSNTCDTHGSSDRRNFVGYAIREIYLGTIDAQGNFKDLLHHSPDQKRSLTYCSSVDPWHQPSGLYLAPDRMESGDQPGLDLFYTSGITRGLPAVIPVAMLYGTPEDSVAQMTYLKKRGYPVWYVEISEEPDGQYMQPGSRRPRGNLHNRRRSGCAIYAAGRIDDRVARPGKVMSRRPPLSSTQNKFSEER